VCVCETEWYCVQYCYAALHTVSSVHGKMHSDWFNGIEILQGRWQHGEKMGYCYPSGLEKTLCKWDIYVPLAHERVNTNIRSSIVCVRVFVCVCTQTHTHTHTHTHTQHDYAFHAQYCTRDNLSVLPLSGAKPKKKWLTMSIYILYCCFKHF
jgi:hypothetical protein